MGVVKNLEITVNVPALKESELATRPSLASILNHPLVSSSDTLRIQLSVSRRRGKSLALNHVRTIASDLLDARDDVSKLEIVAKEDDEAPREPLDLLEARLEADPPILLRGRRAAREDRWQAIRQTLDIWHANGQLA